MPKGEKASVDEVRTFVADPRRCAAPCGRTARAESLVIPGVLLSVDPLGVSEPGVYVEPSQSIFRCCINKIENGPPRWKANQRV